MTNAPASSRPPDFGSARHRSDGGPTATGVTLIPRQRRSDTRGWLLKVLAGTESGLRADVGEAYVVMAEPGEVRGNHFHARTAEWFTVIQGEAEFFLRNEQTGVSETIPLRADEPVTVHVPPGVAHAFRNPADATLPLVVVAYADHRYDPADTTATDLVPEAVAEVASSGG